MTGAALLAQGGLRLAFTMTVARLLGANAYADFAYVFAVATLCAIVWPASAGAAFSRFINEAQARGDRDSKHGAARHLLRRDLQFLVFAVPVVMAVVGLSRHDLGLSLGAGMLALGLCGQAFGRGIHTALGLLGREAILQIASGAGALIAVLALVAAGMEVTASLSVFVLGLAFVVYSLASRPISVERAFALSRVARRRVDGFVLVAVAGSVASAGLPQLSVLSADRQLDDASAGAYAAALSLALPFMLVASAIGMVLYPRMARLVGGNSAHRLSLLRDRATSVLMAASCVGLIIGGICAGPLVARLLGVEFAQSGRLLLVLVLGVIFTAVASPSVSVLSTRGSSSLGVASGSAWAGLLFAGTAWLLGADSAGEIAWSYVGATWVSATAVIVGARKFLLRSSLLPWMMFSGGATGALLAFIAPLGELWMRTTVSGVATLLSCGAVALQLRGGPDGPKRSPESPLD